MALDSTISLLVATFELNAVQLIRGAMRAADIGSGRGQPVSGLGPAPSKPPVRPLTREPAPIFEPRLHVRSNSRDDHHSFSHADAVRYDVVLSQRIVERAADLADCTAIVTPACETTNHPSPFPPVWKTLPPVEHPEPVRRPIKVIRHIANVHNRGIVIDVHA